MTVRMLFLDLDGTVSPYDPVHGGSSARAGGFEMPYRPAVVEWVHRLRAADIEAFWVTTWPAELLPELEAQFGLTALTVPERVDGTSPRPADFHGWKTETMRAVVAARRPERFAWADDHLKPATLGQLRADFPEGMFLSPNGDIGLSDEELGRIETWLLRDSGRDRTDRTAAGIYAHSKRMNIHDIVRTLNGNVGATVVQGMAGTKDRDAPHEWAKPAGPQPGPEIEERLRLGYRVWRMLERSEGRNVALAWLMGANPRLAERMPVMCIQEMQTREVVGAAQAFINDVYG